MNDEGDIFQSYLRLLPGNRRSAIKRIAKVLNRTVFYGNIGPRIGLKRSTVRKSDNRIIGTPQRVPAEIQREGDCCVYRLNIQQIISQIDIPQHGDGAARLLHRRRHRVAQQRIAGHGRAVGGGERRLCRHAAGAGVIVVGVEVVTGAVGDDADVFKLRLVGHVDHAVRIELGNIGVILRQQFADCAPFDRDLVVFAAAECGGDGTEVGIALINVKSVILTALDRNFAAVVDAQAAGDGAFPEGCRGTGANLKCYRFV